MIICSRTACHIFDQTADEVVQQQHSEWLKEQAAQEEQGLQEAESEAMVAEGSGKADGCGK
eukprot:9077805-Karenia_brevis.AAC.1